MFSSSQSTLSSELNINSTSVNLLLSTPVTDLSDSLQLIKRQSMSSSTLNISDFNTIVSNEVLDNTPGGAYDIGVLSGTRTFTNSVGSADTVDYYHFKLNSESPINIALTGLSAGADVDIGLLRRDDNGYDTFATSANGKPFFDSAANVDESINLGLIAANDYWIRVQRISGNSNYTLRLSTATTSNLLPVEEDVGVLNGTRTFGGFVGSTDTVDVYRFNLNALSNGFNVTLTGLQNDADIRLIRDANNNARIDVGEEITDSLEEGTNPERIQLALGAGTYLLQVHRFSGDTSYNLSLSTGDWYSSNLSDVGLIGQVRRFAQDGQLSRTDVISLLRDVKDGDVVTQTEFTDLRKLLSDRGYLMPEHVRVLADKVVNGDVANVNSLADLFQGGNLHVGSTGDQMERLIGKWFLGSDRPIASGTYRYASGSLFQNGLHYSDIDQGSVGDCYFLAAVTATAYQNPNAISNMFIDNGDGTFTVRFFNNGVADYVTVDRYLPANSSNNRIYADWGGGAYNESNNELWVALLEKAYAQLNDSEWIGQDGTNSYSGIAYGNSGAALKHITGRTVSSDNSLDASDISAIISAINSERVITAGTPSNVDSSIPGVVGSHAYAVLGYNATSKKFRLYNPYGGDYGTGTGIVELTHNQFLSNFNVWRVLNS